MNALKKYLIKKHFYPLPKDYGNDVELFGAKIRIYCGKFIRVTSYYNVITSDYLIDSENPNKRMEIYYEEDINLDGDKYSDVALVGLLDYLEIRETLDPAGDNIRIFTDCRDDKLLFVERIKDGFCKYQLEHNYDNVYSKMSYCVER